MRSSMIRRQGGAALVVGLIMLALITLMLLAALNMGTANFRAVSNMQFREEAIGAANRAIEQVISSNFTAAPGPEDVFIDLDDDGDTDYTVRIATPVCVSATQAFGAPRSSRRLGPGMSVASTWNTVWDLRAFVDRDENPGGAEVAVRAGVRVLLTEAQRNAVCN